MRKWLHLRSGATLVVVLLIVAVGVAYALEIRRGIEGLVIVGQVQTPDQTILVWKSIEPNKEPLTHLEYGTIDINAFGLFREPPRIPLWVENGGDVPFALRIEVRDVKVNGEPAGDILAINLEGPPRFSVKTSVEPRGIGTVHLSPPPGPDGRYPEGTEVTLEARLNLAHAEFIRWEGDASGTDRTTTVTVDRDLRVHAVFLHIGTPTPRATARPAQVATPTPRILPTPTPTPYQTPTPTPLHPPPPPPPIGILEPGQVVGLQVGLRLLRTPQDLGIDTGATITFTAFFKAQGPLPTATPTPNPTPPPPVPTGTLNVGFNQLGAFSSHPRLTGFPQARYVGTTLGETLLAVDGEANFRPKLAREWSLSPDGLEWTFSLSRRAQFHKGYGEMTAADVIFSLQVAGEEGTRNPFWSQLRRLCSRS